MWTWLVAWSGPVGPGGLLRRFDQVPTKSSEGPFGIRGIWSGDQPGLYLGELFNIAVYDLYLHFKKTYCSELLKLLCLQ